jgi:dihydroflavonol-4-reductase
MSKVLVTGATGFIASHIINLFLNEGYKVVGTVRSINSNDQRLNQLLKLSENTPHKLELVEADLTDDSCWERVIKDIDIVVHTATDTNLNAKDEKTVIKPAVDGTLSILNASLKADVKRFVFTGSSFAVTGTQPEDRVYSENDWPNVQIHYNFDLIALEETKVNF